MTGDGICSEDIVGLDRVQNAQRRQVMSLLNDRLKDQLDYSIALQSAIWYHCQGKEVPPHIAKSCPHHAQMLNKSL